MVPGGGWGGAEEAGYPYNWTQEPSTASGAEQKLCDCRWIVRNSECTLFFVVTLMIAVHCSTIYKLVDLLANHSLGSTPKAKRYPSWELRWNPFVFRKKEWCETMKLKCEIIFSFCKDPMWQLNLHERMGDETVLYFLSLAAWVACVHGTMRWLSIVFLIFKF